VLRNNKLSDCKKIDERRLIMSFMPIMICQMRNILNRIKINYRKILDFLTKAKNPYVFKVNGKLVRMSFSENGPTADECLTRVLENLYR